MEELRNLTKERYTSLRKTVRQNIMVNSRYVYLNRFKFTDTPVLMGGIVIQREEIFECISGYEHIEVAQFLTKEEFEGSRNNATESDWLKPIGYIKQLQFKIFDFSGHFTILIDRDLIREARLRFFKVKGGDLVYVIGKIIPINESSNGYFLLPADILTEKEFEFYKEVYSDQFREMKNKVQKAKLKEYIPTISDILNYHRERFEVIRLFLSKNDGISEPDYFWLINAIVDIYRERPCRKLAQLAYRYFYRWHKSRSGVSENPMENFRDWYPNLTGEM